MFNLDNIGIDTAPFRWLIASHIEKSGKNGVFAKMPDRLYYGMQLRLNSLIKKQMSRVRVGRII